MSPESDCAALSFIFFILALWQLCSDCLRHSPMKVLSLNFSPFMVSNGGSRPNQKIQWVRLNIAFAITQKWRVESINLCF